MKRLALKKPLTFAVLLVLLTPLLWFFGLIIGGAWRGYWEGKEYSRLVTEGEALNGRIVSYEADPPHVAVFVEPGGPQRVARATIEYLDGQQQKQQVTEIWSWDPDETKHYYVGQSVKVFYLESNTKIKAASEHDMLIRGWLDRIARKAGKQENN